jgi:hypothetical protein
VHKQWGLYVFMVAGVGLMGWPRAAAGKSPRAAAAKSHTKFVKADGWLDDRSLDEWLGRVSNARQAVAIETEQASTKATYETMRNYWRASQTGHWSKDCRRGGIIAQCFASQLKRQPELLNLVVRDMIARGRYGGVEAGFCGMLAQIVLAPDNHALNGDLDRSIIKPDQSIVAGPIGDK